MGIFHAGGFDVKALVMIQKGFRAEPEVLGWGWGGCARSLDHFSTVPYRTAQNHAEDHADNLWKSRSHTVSGR